MTTSSEDTSVRDPLGATLPVAGGQSAAAARWSRVAPVPVVALTVVALGALQLVASWTLLHRPINVDESFTIVTVRGGLSSLRSGVRADPGMAGYYAPLWLLRHVIGSSVVSLRLVSFASYVVAISVICWWANRRGRLPWAAALVLVMGLTPAFRMVAVEARAYMPAGCAALLAAALVALDRRPGAGRAADWLAAAGAAAVSLTHPSALGAASFMWLAFCFFGWRRRRLGAAHVLSGLVILGAGLAGVFQAEASISVARRGLAGVTNTASALFGVSVLTAALMFVVVGVVVVTDGRRDDAALVAAGGAFLYIALGLMALPFKDVAPFFPRYFVVTATLIVLSGALVKAAGWRVPLLVVAVTVCAAGSVVRIDTRLSGGFEFCSLATDLDREVEAGDAIVFVPPVIRSMVVACLDTDVAESLLDRAPFLPRVSRSDLQDPRALFFGASVRVDDVEAHAFNWYWLVADQLDKPLVLEIVAKLESSGAHCTTEPVGRSGAILCQY